MDPRFEIIIINDVPIARILPEGIIIQNEQDALDLIANCYYNGASRLLIHETQIHPDFFDLKTGIAGEILQKFSNYQSQLAIIGDFSRYTSKSLQDFIRESNRQGRIFFVEDEENGIEKLSQSQQ
jgi:hypothetical protein